MAEEYCKVNNEAWWGDRKTDGICLQRITTKARGVEEIRLAWWKKGKMMPRPADIDVPDWIILFGKAIEAGVFTDTDKMGMLKALLK